MGSNSPSVLVVDPGAPSAGIERQKIFIRNLRKNHISAINKSSYKTEHDTLHMDIFSSMELDHEAVRAQFLKLQNLPLTQHHARAEQFGQLKDALSLHLDTEEQVLYSTLSRILPQSRILHDALEQHKKIRLALNELDHIPVESQVWMDRFNSLSDLFIRHTLQEEIDLFPQAWDMLEEATLKNLMQRTANLGQVKLPDRL
ncbi:MAG: hemerythrin domain-containing protein [Pseudomonadota bacterium]|nr:hemerythrin domain-containing protein [Pseudomonadota bacterium]